MADKALTLPESGKCVVAHPNREAFAIKCADENDCPYLLREIVPDEPAVFVADLDAMVEIGSGAYHRLFPELPEGEWYNVDLGAMGWRFGE